MKTIFLALLMISWSVVSASVVKFPDKIFLDVGVDDFELDKYKPGSAQPGSAQSWADIEQLPNGLVVAAAHNNVPERVLENLDKHPLGCCNADTSVQSVPLPAAAWLFMSGLAVLVRVGHRRKK